MCFELMVRGTCTRQIAEAGFSGKEKKFSTFGRCAVLFDSTGDRPRNKTHYIRDVIMKENLAVGLKDVQKVYSCLLYTS
ncbi:MAG: hypothetical protein N3G20_00900, partial [Verrucomicrobiae bacterium]|nr:hypothetical protein [Verrucomicrobiae bacterium]